MTNLNKHVASDRVKWIISFVLIALLVIAVAGLTLKVFKSDKLKDKTTVIALYDGSVDTEVISTKEVKGIKMEVVGTAEKLKDGGEYAGKTYLKTSQMGGKSSDTRYIEITIPKKYDGSTLYLVVAPNGDTERNVSVQTETAAYNEKYFVLMTNADSKVFVGGTTAPLKAGTYYIGFDSDIRFAEISVILPKPLEEEENSSTLDSSVVEQASEIVSLYNGTVDTALIATKEVNGVTMEVVGVAGSVKNGGEYNGKTYLKSSQMGGSSSNSRYIKITVPEAVDSFTIYIVAASNGNDVRSISVQPESATYSETNKILDTEASSSILAGATTEHLTPGEYYIAFSKDVVIAEITVYLYGANPAPATSSVSNSSSTPGVTQYY